MVNAYVKKRTERRIARRRLRSRLATQCRKNHARLVEMFEQGCRLQEIRDAIVPDLSNWSELPSNIVQAEFNKAIALTLGYENLYDYEKAHLEVWAKVRRRRKIESGWTEARKAALERDGYKCVITGRTENLQVHHIDGNSLNNQLDNLITLHRSYHTIAAHSRNRETKKGHLRTIEYAKYLRSHGYPNTKLIHCSHCGRRRVVARK